MSGRGATGLPPGPRSPAIWQTLAWVRRPYPFLAACRARYGEAFTVRFSGWGTMVFVSSPETIKRIFGSPAGALHAGAANEIMRPLLGGASILLVDGERHLHRRRLLQPRLRPHSPGSLCRELRDLTETASSGWPRGRPFALHERLEEISLAFILRLLFGRGEEARRRSFASSLRTLLGPWSAAVAFVRPLQRDLGRLSPGGWFRGKVAALDALLDEEIRLARRRGPGAETLLGALLAATDEAGEPLTGAELRDHLVTLLVAGHDPTATALAWAFHWLLATPGVLERLRAELDELPDAAPEEVLSRPYLEAVCHEALRITPVVEAVQRVAREPLAVDGFAVPPGVMVAPCTYLVHRREDLYPEAERFRPERFLERNYTASEFFPFGGGTRRCLGAALALAEMKVVIATVLGAFDLRAVAPERVRPVRRNVTVAPSDGVRVVATRRR